MRKRRLFVVVFLLISVLFLGIGYATLTNKLTISGKVSAKENHENLKVEFVSYESYLTNSQNGFEDKSFIVNTNISAKSATIDIDDISIPGQTATIIFKLQNNSIELESLTAYLSRKITIELDNVVYETVCFPENDSYKCVKNEYFAVSARYSKNGENSDSLGKIKDGIVSLAANEYIYLIVSIQLIDIVPENFISQTIKIKFDATTTKPTA